MPNAIDPLETAAPPETAAPASQGVAQRYQLNEEEDGGRVVLCSSVPSMRLHVVKGLTVTEEDRRRYPERTVFLDGSFVGPPFLDNTLRQYSLDHHYGCVRSFTLASCEQAAIILWQGLPLEEGQWQLYINEPDLDALLAAWLLFNHRQLKADEGALLRQVMPFVRVQGLIDAHGLGMEQLSGLAQENYASLKSRIDGLLTQERSLKAAGTWAGTDWPAYSRDMLHGLDTLLFPTGYLETLRKVEEVAQAPLPGQRLAVLCRSKQGIYAVETVLKERYAGQLGLIILDQGQGRFTLRQVDRFLEKDLTAVYPALNDRDQHAARGKNDGNRWGGSNEIGGSPRRSGSALGGLEVLRVVNKVHNGGWLSRVAQRLRPGNRSST